jgi:hypothetical protein
VLVVFSRPHVFLLELFLDIAPNFTHLEVRVHLDHLQFLLLIGIEVVSGKAHSVENGEDNQSDVILFNFFSNSIDLIFPSRALMNFYEKLFMSIFSWLGVTPPISMILGKLGSIVESPIRLNTLLKSSFRILPDSS